MPPRTGPPVTVLTNEAGCTKVDFVVGGGFHGFRGFRFLGRPLFSVHVDGKGDRPPYLGAAIAKG